MYFLKCVLSWKIHSWFSVSYNYLYSRSTVTEVLCYVWRWYISQEVKIFGSSTLPFLIFCSFFQASIFLLQVKNRKTNKSCKIGSKFTTNTIERRYWCCSGALSLSLIIPYTYNQTLVFMLYKKLRWSIDFYFSAGFCCYQ